MIVTLIFAATAAGGWQFETLHDPLGQPVYVAEVVPDAARPHVALRFLCGGMTGVVLQFNLGEPRYAGMQFSRREPEWEDVRFEFEEGPYKTTAKRAPIMDGIGTYEIKGSEAAFVADLLKTVGSVSIKREHIAFTFPLDGAATAIGEVLSACPYRYRG
jgi:hypothetical protein